MAAVYDIRLNGRSGAVNLGLRILTIAAVAGSARILSADLQICRNLDQLLKMLKRIEIRRLTTVSSGRQM